MAVISGRKKRLFIGIGILAVIAVCIGAYMFLYPGEEQVNQVIVMPKPSPRAPVTPPRAPVKPKAAEIEVVAVSNVAPATPPPAASVSVATPVQALPPSLKSRRSSTKVKPARSKSADLRSCLELGTDQAIAKCAGE